VVTLGPAGAAVLSLRQEPPGQVHRQPAPAVDAVDTTGCGVAFPGALAHRIAPGDDAIAASRFAVRVGVFAATRPGAQACDPTAQELDRFIAAMHEGAATRELSLPVGLR